MAAVMRRGWAWAAFGGGLAVWAVTTVTFVVEIGDHDIAEGIGLLTFVTGLFLVWEGGFSLWRARAVASRDKPK